MVCQLPPCWSSRATLHPLVNHFRQATSIVIATWILNLKWDICKYCSSTTTIDSTSRIEKSMVELEKVQLSPRCTRTFTLRTVHVLLLSNNDLPFANDWWIHVPVQSESLAASQCQPVPSTCVSLIWSAPRPGQCPGACPHQLGLRLCVCVCVGVWNKSP